MRNAGGLGITVFVMTVLCGCVSLDNHNQNVANEPLPIWMQEIASYRTTLPADHPHLVNSLFSISDEMRETVLSKFGSMPKERAAKRLANWLIDEEGHAMDYDVSADFRPIQAFEKKRGNCLSFTILLASLAAELNIEISFNEVDLPDTWSLQEERRFILYRHVNGLYKGVRGNTIFDLAMENYNFNYPQRVISKELAAAKLLSNKGIAALANKDFAVAEHYLKLAISIVPDNADLWVNYGVVLKRQGFLDKAKQSFIRSFALNPSSSTAASNLERIYRHSGALSLANRYRRLANRLRLKNPYYHFYLSKQYFDDGSLTKSRRAINRAKRLYNKDPRFYELSSRLYQREENLAKAFSELRKAHSLALDIRARGRYAMKAIRLNQLALDSIENQ